MGRTSRATTALCVAMIVAPSLGAALEAQSAPPAPAAPPAVPQARVRVFKRDSTGRDSTLQVRITMDGANVEQLVREFMSSRAMEETIARSMREAADDPARQQQLRRDLEQLSRRTAGLSTAIRMQCTRTNEPQPDGYLGVTFEQIMISRERNEPAIYTLGQRPTIESVEPGSPADKAGLRSGDLVITIGGEDAHRLKLESILKPGAKVPVKVQRNGTPREVTVVVGKRPENYGATTCTTVDDLVGPDMPQVSNFRRSGTMVRVPAPPVAPAMPVAPSTFVFGVPLTTMNSLGGATVVLVDENFREALGVERGVLVTSVARNSPAFESGLRSADVIVAVDDVPVNSVVAVLRAVGASESRAVRLSIVRQRKPQTITFRVR
jgi:C-terminal processing protease CtpA/Prc